MLKDKPVTEQTHSVSAHTLLNRKNLNIPGSQVSDLPVAKSYLDSLQTAGISVICTSRWLNAVSAFLDDDCLQATRQFSFVQEILPIDRSLQISSYASDNFTPEYYSTVMGQVGASAFTQQGFTGTGVTIGVIDVGFFGVTSNKSLQHLLGDNRITDVQDYVNPSRTDHFTQLETNSDFHGTEVLQMIAGFEQEKKLQYGMATGAKFCLARTDHGIKETRQEEDNWIMAMERMDSLGIRLINTSLGYALGFTNPKENYKPQEMDGKTSIISRATRIATEEKGMLIVVSAGNEGDDPNWRIVSTPADAEGVLSVGATKAKSRDKIGYSSIGPEFLPYLKPNVACFSPSGTSFSAPVITGFAACLLQAEPSLSNKQLKQLIERSAHLYPYGNNFVGYGVPDARKALQLLKDSTLAVNNTRVVKQKGNTLSISVENSSVERAVLFRKKNQYIVLEQKLVGITKGKLELKRLPAEKYTTIDLGNEVVEVVWE
jgi:subtilisin family serine protease